MISIKSLSRLALVCGLAFALNACAPPEKVDEGTDPAAGLPEEGGFFEPTDASVPAGVRQASASVFQIVVPTRDKLQEIDTSYGVGAGMRTYFTLTETDPMMRAIMIAQLDYCEKRQQFFNSANKKCKVALSFNKGSGFLLGNGQSFWTAAHILDRAFAEQEGLRNFIFDKTGKLIFDPFAQPSVVSRPHPTLITAQLDYAALTLPVTIGEPLTVATRRPFAREEIFAIGFPSCTNCIPAGSRAHDFRARTTGPDSNGKDLRVSRGRPYAMFEPPLVHTSVDVIPGNSGGPGVTADGQVFGVAILSGSSMFRASVHRLGIFVTPPGWRGLVTDTTKVSSR